MYARVVRFTDVTDERLADVLARIEESEGPPPGVDSTGFQFLFDEKQRTALFIGLFSSEEKMREADEILGQMDASETPGNRASVDHCEIKAEGTA
jgi:hypothetical protein